MEQTLDPNSSEWLVRIYSNKIILLYQNSDLIRSKNLDKFGIGGVLFTWLEL